MVEQFLLKYFPPDKTAKYRAKITKFRTDDDESLHAAWERFKGLLRKCPHHGLTLWLQCQTFFDALSGYNKQAIDHIAGGDFGAVSPNEAYQALEKAAKKSFAYKPARATTIHKGMHQVETSTLITAQLEALTKKFDQLQSEISTFKLHCIHCGGQHKMSDCKKLNMIEEVDYIGRQQTSSMETITIKDGGIIQISAGRMGTTINLHLTWKRNLQNQGQPYQRPHYQN